MADPKKDPSHILEAGAEILKPTLGPYGFAFQMMRIAAQSSGGPFADGRFVSGTKQLELHFRWSLGGVTYIAGGHSLSHENYMRSLKVHRQAEYPGYSKEPLAAFEHLASDIKRFCQDFLQGDGQEIVRYANELAVDPKKFKGLP